MAHSEKPGIRYLSVDVDILTDRKVRRVLSACGPAAMAVILRRLCNIYGDRGYCALPEDNYFLDATCKRVHNNTMLLEYRLPDAVKYSDGDGESDIRSAQIKQSNIRPQKGERT